VSGAELTIARAATLGAIVEATYAGRRITWMPRGDLDAERPLEGTLRHFSDRDGDGGHATSNAGDIRDKFVRISTAVEHWVRVDELADWIESSAAYLQ